MLAINSFIFPFVLFKYKNIFVIAELLIEKRGENELLINEMWEWGKNAKKEKVITFFTILVKGRDITC